MNNKRGMKKYQEKEMRWKKKNQKRNMYENEKQNEVNKTEKKAKIIFF